MHRTTKIFWTWSGWLLYDDLWSLVMKKQKTKKNPMDNHHNSQKSSLFIVSFHFILFFKNFFVLRFDSIFYYEKK